MAIPKTQSAFGYEKGTLDLVQFDDEPVQTPGDNELLLKVEAAGLCMSDPHLIQSGPLVAKVGQEAPPERFVMGHEIAGQVAAVGDNLKNDPRYKEGTRFSMQIAIACGACENCRTGIDNQCSQSAEAYGLNAHGGFQQYLLVKNLRSLLPIPDNVSYETAAVSTDSVLTPFHAVQKVKNMLNPTSKVLVVGIGGLGINALQILNNYGVHIVAVDVKESLKDIALSNGAKEFHTDIFKSSHPLESFDVCFDFVGMQPTSDICQKFVKHQGKIVSIGLGRSKFTIYNFHMARREVQYIFCFGGTSAEQIEMMKWISLGKLKPHFNVYDFKELPDYLGKLVMGEIEGRAVFRPSKL
ncbi:GroES-like protein [Suhomyces tanzawaensis NRRL Y-17324]|uniref:GroES-like protein n=1 Tax=Suhomyces tanzawaensis NRRL Y-17324 TaxID=984487 RepID=A0A1E4SJY0_9ASCO|nr:GroES-like protein [Suhomyces tanzawaensis NRRL Y-17324]ODV79809.1 GroES-like protein [Suhomyces tanzawaensis NRRL Y-17324]